MNWESIIPQNINRFKEFTFQNLRTVRNNILAYHHIFD